MIVSSDSESLEEDPDDEEPVPVEAGAEEPVFEGVDALPPSDLVPVAAPPPDLCRRPSSSAQL